MSTGQWLWNHSAYLARYDPFMVPSIQPSSSSLIAKNTSQFYDITPSGNLTYNLTNMPYAYPTGAVFPNVMAYQQSIPYVSLPLTYRPFY